MVILNSTDEPLLGAKIMVETGGCPTVNTSAALSARVSRILEDEPYRRSLIDQGASLVRDVYESFGDEAAARIAAEVFAAASISREQRAAL